MREQFNAHPHTCSRDTPLLLVPYSSHFTLKSSYWTCNYFLPRTHRMVLFIPHVFISHGTVYMCVLSLFHIGLILSLLTSHLHPSVFLSLIEHSCQTHRSTPRKHLSFICRLCGCSNLETGWICPCLLTAQEVFCLTHTHTHTHTNTNTNTQASVCLSTCDLC